MIQLKNLQYTWPGQDNPILTIKDWQLSQGDRVFLYGSSGSGKSTLLNILAGLLQPQQGSVRVLDTEITTLGARARDAFRARHMGFIFQQFNLLSYLSVETNIQLAAHFGVKNRSISPDRIIELMQQLSLGEQLLSQKAGQLSVGQQQRVAMVRALINHPQIIIADEPTSALDSDARDEFIELLLQCADNNQSSVIFVSHDKSLASHFSLSININDLNSLAVSS
ncbi:MAG: ABC transporter ATP-binding protein [Gammaproteobacteria bacterium]|nr:ABC transporter ATP-binding protein [Gammaproteobacteria bacterium]